MVVMKQADDFRARCIANGFDPIGALTQMDLYPEVQPKPIIIEDDEGYDIPHTLVEFPDGSQVLLEQIAECIIYH